MERPAGAAATALEPTENAPARHDPYAAFRSRNFALFSFGNAITIVGKQMLALAVGWDVLHRTHSPTALGLIGLVFGLPVLLFALPAGHCADRFSRKRILFFANAVAIASSLGMAFLAFQKMALPAWPPLLAAARGLGSVAAFFEGNRQAHFDAAIPLIFALLFLSGTARAFGWAARGAFLPNLVPARALPNAMAWNSSSFQIASTIGPAAGGLVIALWGPIGAYGLDALCAIIFLLLLLPIHAPQERSAAPTPGLRGLLGGLEFVWSRQIIFATITLDLFAVLLGGATALLPIFAEQILHVGAIGFGWLRAAPAIGALVSGLLIAHLPPMRHAGRTLLWAVTGFGVVTVIFGLSHSFWLSLAMLTLTGVFDSVSVIVRHTLLQILTPDFMRGRVSAVNNVFIGSSNEFGAFESGITAATFGPVASVVGGGIGTILVVIAAACLWPELRRFGRLVAEPEPRSAAGAPASPD